MPGLYVGLMSGTSLDGVDAVLVDLSGRQPRLVAHQHEPFESGLRSELLALNHSSHDELRRAARAANELARVYASIVTALLERTGITPLAVEAIGCHGQTVRHQPADGYTIQLVNGSLLAELTAISVVCDFRSRDVAAGGQGAPLVSAFHEAVFRDTKISRATVNIGGIANITALPAHGHVIGFDCGPGNMLLDAWVKRHRQLSFDRDGEWARSGKVIDGLLARLRDDAYFQLLPPKSTGREAFDLNWLTSKLDESEKPNDVQATLLALTAECIADAIEKFCKETQEVYLCGGGARNAALVETLSARLAPHKVAASDELGTNAEHVEALAFAWLAQQALAARPGNLPTVTGARGPRTLGAIYRA